MQPRSVPANEHDAHAAALGDVDNLLLRSAAENRHAILRRGKPHHHVERFAERHAPSFELPRVFAGYPVGSDVRADLAFTLGFLDELDITSIAGMNTREAVTTVLGGIDGSQTHTFFSYRVVADS